MALEKPAFEDAPVKVVDDLRKNWMIALGIVVLAVPAIGLLHFSDKVFRDECKQKCYVTGMDYRVRAVRKSDPMEYPAECICIPMAERQWWEFWK